MNLSRFGRLLLLALPVLALLSIGTSTASSALVCTPTTFMQDGRPLTAALINPLVVPENLDATGCDIGIYYSSGTHSLVDNSVFGSGYYGVLSNGSGVVTTISQSSVYDIGENPHNGSQHGMGIAYRNGASGQVDHSQVFDYQKGGVLVTGAGSSANVVSNTIRGLGPVPFIAQNGVQVSSGAAATVNDNFIEDHQYTGCSKADAKATGCVYVVSTGILLFDVDPAVVDTKNNTYRNNDVNLLNASNAS